MSKLISEEIKDLLSQYQDPYLSSDLVTAKVLRDIKIEENKATLDLSFGFPIDGYKPILEAELNTLFAKLDMDIAYNISFNITSHAVQQNVKPLASIKNIIAVASGKGGVGKSTTSVNLALALQAEGANVGILDADIYGPSQPLMLGVEGKPDVDDEKKKILPKIAYGIQAMSMGLMVDDEQPMIWRGPMVTQALEQMIRDVLWQDLDYLIIDLPPGTGDVQLTLSQKIPVSGAVIVTTPQDIALLDARKALKMFEKVRVPVLGVVENMSIHICSNCGHSEAIFGADGGQKMADDYDVKLLGQLPLDKGIRENADSGKPTVAASPDSDIAAMYRDIARKTAAQLSLKSKDYSSAFPNIVIENN